MRLPIIAAIAGVAVLAAGGIYYGIAMYPQRQLRMGIDQMLAKLPAGTTVTYQDARYSVASRTVVISGIVVHSDLAGKAGKPLDVTIDTIETTNPNLAFSEIWDKAVANPAAFDMDTGLPVADRIAIKGINARAEAFTLTQESTRIEKPRVYPGVLLHPGVPSLRDLQTMMGTSGTPPKIEDLAAMARLQAAYFLGSSNDGYQTAALKLTIAAPAMNLAYDVKGISGTGQDHGILKGGKIDGISVSGAGLGSFTFDAVSTGPIDVRDAATRIVKGEALSLALLDQVKIGRFEYSGVNMTVAGQPPFQLGGMFLGPIAFAQGMPVTGGMGWTDLRVTAAQMPDANAREAFKQSGLDSATISFAAAYDWDVANKTATIRDTVLKVNELGTLTLNAIVTNLGPPPSPPDRAALSKATLVLTDASLVERALKVAAAQSGAQPAAFKTQFIAQTKQQAAALDKSGNKVMASLMNAVVDFVSDPRRLTIQLSPPTPIPVMTLQRVLADPNRFGPRLGLTATVTPK